MSANDLDYETSMIDVDVKYSINETGEISLNGVWLDKLETIKLLEEYHKRSIALDILERAGIANMFDLDLGKHSHYELTATNTCGELTMVNRGPEGDPDASINNSEKIRDRLMSSMRSNCPGYNYCEDDVTYNTLRSADLSMYVDGGAPVEFVNEADIVRRTGSTLPMSEEEMIEERDEMRRVEYF